ncbi:hypothetical protein NQZ68_025185 [Dissostichus eleginoides]|nr:hypothetical protein NQZ68_025185 [Dissostichus eleginoides]
MADDIDFLSDSCKQDVTDLICLSAHLNLKRRLEAGERKRRREQRSEGVKPVVEHLALTLFWSPVGNLPLTPSHCHKAVVLVCYHGDGGAQRRLLFGSDACLGRETANAEVE